MGEIETLQRQCEKLIKQRDQVNHKLTKANELIGKIEVASKAYIRALPDDVHFEDCVTTVDEEEECDCGIIKAENNLIEALEEIAKWRKEK